MELLFEVNYADTSGKNPKTNKDKFKQLEIAKKLYSQLLEKDECVSLKELHISGKDLIAAGFKPGRGMGLILNRLLEAVIEDQSLNDKDILLDMAKALTQDEAVRD